MQKEEECFEEGVFKKQATPFAKDEDSGEKLDVGHNEKELTEENEEMLKTAYLHPFQRIPEGYYS